MTTLKAAPGSFETWAAPRSNAARRYAGRWARSVRKTGLRLHGGMATAPVLHIASPFDLSTTSLWNDGTSFVMDCHLAANYGSQTFATMGEALAAVEAAYAMALDRWKV